MTTRGPYAARTRGLWMLNTQADASLGQVGRCNSMSILFCLRWTRGSGHEAGWLCKLSHFV